MSKEFYRYTFSPSVPTGEVEATLLVAIWGTQSLHGEAQYRLDAAHRWDRHRRVCVIDASTPVGRDFNRLFVGFSRRGFSVLAFDVERVCESPA